MNYPSTNTTHKNRKVVYIATIIPQYKAWIVEAMDRELGNGFTAIHGSERAGTVPRDVGARLGIRNNRLVKNKYVRLGGTELTWIPSFLWILRNKPDVVILVDQIKILSNIPIHVLGRMKKFKVIYYSHGYNHQASMSRLNWVSRLVEWLRIFVLTRADGVIAYDRRGTNYLEDKRIGCPIFVSDNTLNTTPILSFYESHSGLEFHQLFRREFGIDSNSFVITFVGRLIKEKRVDFFIDVVNELASETRRKVQGQVIGDGPLMDLLRSKAQVGHVRFVGYKSGQELWRRLLVSDIVFIPGMVGLAIVEAFCAGKPFVTVDHEYHSPEICYLKPDKNGVLIKSFNVDVAVMKIKELLDNQDTVCRLGKEAQASAYMDCSPDNMTRAFLSAIEDGG